MNAAIRAVVRTAIAKGLTVKGIERGYAGLENEEIIDMDAKSVSDIIQRGGTIFRKTREKYSGIQEPRNTEGRSGYLPKSAVSTAWLLSAATVPTAVRRH